MLKYLKITIRFLSRHKEYTWVNILGLALSFFCTLFIGLYIFNELSYDRAYPYADRIFRVVESRQADDGTIKDVADVGYRLSTLNEQLPSIEKTTRITTFGRANISGTKDGERFAEPFHVSDQTLLDVFGVRILAGTKENALTEPHTVVITRSLAIKLFGTFDAADRLIYTHWDDQPFKVTAVISDFPGNSHIHLNLIASIETYAGSESFQRSVANDWSSTNFTVYLRARADTKTEDLATSITGIVNDNRGEDEPKSGFHLQPITDIHFNSASIDGGYNDTPGDITYLYVFGIVGVFILLISCVNYVNLSTALSLVRYKEVGVKKSVGAARGNLMRQFTLESCVISLVAMTAALAASMILLPAFNQLAGKTFSVSQLIAPGLLVAAVLFAIGVGALSGAYPALLLSRLKPALAMRTSGGKSRGLFRRSLVVIQFTLSIALIFGTLVVWQQLHYIQQKDLGFDHEQVVVLDINSGNVRKGFQTIKNEIERIPEVVHVCVSSRVPGEWKNLPEVAIGATGHSEPLRFHLFGADEDFLSTFNMKLLNGRNFNATSDSSSFIINETAARALGFEDPLSEGLRITSVNYSVEDDPLDKPFEGRIIGVVQDFYFQSLHQKITPVVIAYRNNPIQAIDYFSVRLRPGNWQATLKQIGGVLLSVDPNHSNEFNFLDDRLRDFYNQDVRRSKIFALGAIVSIGLACLGLFSLASFMTQRRTKEIGIRKVLGASVAEIVMMLSGSYLRLVLLAFVLAVPFALWVSNLWLASFAYRIDVGWFTVTAACFLAMAITLITVGHKSLIAAMSNPVYSLRNE